MGHTLRIACAVSSLLLVAALAGCGGSAGPGPSPVGTNVPTTATTPTSTPGPDTPIPNAPLPSPPSTGRAMLWPFADDVAAQEWQKQFRAGGAQPWHLDASATALGFTQGYLGFTGIDRVTSTETSADGKETWIGVGYPVPGGGPVNTAAVLHLVRIGIGNEGPWEVVGTRDTSITLDTPAYGSAVSWPLTVGGVITGVDESLHVRVLGPAGPAADACCTPAGGEKSRWTVQVPMQTQRQGDLTVVVATGGHVVDVEVFAITAVRG